MKQIIHFFLALIITIGSCHVSEAQNKTSKKKKRTNAETKDSREQQKLQYAFGEALRLKTTFNFNEALAFFEECIRIDPEMAAAYFEAANIYHVLNQPIDALNFALKAATLEPNNYWYQMLYLESLEKLDRHKEALNLAIKLHNQFSTEPDLANKLALLHFMNRQYEKGIDVLNQEEKKYGLVEALIVTKKVAYLKLGRFEEALQEVEKLTELNPEDLNNYLDKVDLLEALDREEEAELVMQELVRKFPEEGGVRLSLAEFYRKNNQEEKAFDELKIAFANPSLSIDLKMKILLSYFSVINTQPELKDDANELNEILIRTHPDDAKAHTIYGDFLYNENKLKKAKYHFSKAIELDNSRFAIWNQLIIIEIEQENYDSVIVATDQAKEYFPNQPSLYYFAGLAQFQLKNFKSAAEQFEYGKNMTFDNDQLLLQFELNLGDTYNEIGMHKKSDEAFDRALIMDPDNANVLNNYAYYLSLRNENLEKAEEMSARSNKLAENQASYLDTYAWILYKQGKYEQAAEWIQKALKHGGDLSPEVLEHAGDIYFRLNQKEKALEFWKKAKLIGEGTPFLDRKIKDTMLYE